MTRQVLSLAKNPIMMTDNQARLTRRQLLRALVGLTCVDHRAVHPSERMYILQQLDEEDEEGRQAAAGAEQDAADIQLAQAMEEVLPIVLDTAIDDPRLLVDCATVCSTWRAMCRERIGATLSALLQHGHASSAWRALLVW